MKKISLLLSLMATISTTIFSKSNVSANIPTHHFGAVTITNKSKKNATLTGITINYALQTDLVTTQQPPINTNPKIVIKKEQSVQFQPGLQLATDSKILDGGVSEIQINNSDTIKFTTPWIQDASHKAICIDHNGTKWVLANTCKKATKIKNKKTSATIITSAKKSNNDKTPKAKNKKSVSTIPAQSPINNAKAKVVPTPK